MKIYLYIMVLFTIGYAGVRYGAGKQLQRLIGPHFYFAIASTYLVAFLTPWPLILLLWAAGMMWVGVKSRAEIACRYVLLLPTMPALTPFLMIGSHMIGQFTPADFVGFGALAASVAMRSREPQPAPRGFGAEEITVIMLIAIFGIASVRFNDISLLIRTLLSQVMMIGMPFWIIRRNVRTREELLLVAACIGCVAAILSVLAVYERHVGWALFDTLGERYLQGGGYLARSSMQRGGALRASTTLGGPIEFGIFLMLGLLGAYSARSLFTRTAAWAGMLGVIFVGILTTQSRSSLIAAVIGGVVVLLVQRRWAMLGTVVGGALAVYAFLSALATSSVRVAAFLGAGRQVGHYKDYRTLLLERGLQEAQAHRWFGTSMDEITRRLRDITQGEHIIDFVNTYLHIYLMSGVVGLTVLGLAFFAIYPGLWQRARTGLDAPGEMARAFTLGGLTAMAIQLVGVSFYGRVPLLFAVMLGFARVIRRSEARFYRAPIRPVLWETGQLRAAPAQPAPAI